MKNPKYSVHTSKVRSKNPQESHHKDGFIHSDSSSKVEILNEEFVSACTREDSLKILTKGPSSHPSMEPIEVQSKGVHNLLLNLRYIKQLDQTVYPTSS